MSRFLARAILFSGKIAVAIPPEKFFYPKGNRSVSKSQFYIIFSPRRYNGLKKEITTMDATKSRLSWDGVITVDNVRSRGEYLALRALKIDLSTTASKTHNLAFFVVLERKKIFRHSRFSRCIMITNCTHVYFLAFFVEI